MRTLFTILAALLIASVADTKPAPDKPPPKVPPKKTDSPPPLPVLPANTNWGKLTQSGRDFQLKGHPVWEGVGRIREDGRVFILWTLLSSGDPCPGVYDWQDGELRGHWGFADNVQITPQGEIVGSIQQDRTHAVELPKEDEPGF